MKLLIMQSSPASLFSDTGMSEGPVVCSTQRNVSLLCRRYVYVLQSYQLSLTV